MGEIGWAQPFNRPFVGTLTLELQTDADEEIASWIAAGTPPVYFGLAASGRVSGRHDRDDQRGLLRIRRARLIGAAGSDFMASPILTTSR